MGKIVISLVCFIFLVVLGGGAGAVTDVDSCTSITSPGVYVLTADIINSTASTCINITSSDVVFDGAGYTVDGVDDYSSIAGIYVHGTFDLSLVNVTVKNVTVTDWYTGIVYEFVDNSTGGIRNVTASSNIREGIYLDSSNNTAITDNSVFESGDGIYLLSSSNNTIKDNTVNSNNYDGISLIDSSNNIITYNTVTNNGGAGIYFWDSSSNILSNNTASSNDWSGINLDSSSNNTLTNNTANLNYWDGIALWGSSNNTIKDNTASNNYGNGIYITGEIPASNNTVSGNTIRWNECGICMDFEDMTVIEGNLITHNTRGVYLTGSSDNLIYNNFLNNIDNAYDDGTNSWNISKTPGTNIVGGQYLGGNYWATPDGTGFSETCEDSDGDGICDSSYNLTSMNVDHLPLTYPIRNMNTNLTYPTIQAAIDAPETQTGHIITVSAGTYAENVDVNKSLNIIGAGADVTIINALNPNDYVFEVTVNYVNISGFTVTGSTGVGWGGISLSNASYCNILNNNVSTNHVGIRLYPSSNNNIIANNIVSSNDYYGINLHGASNNTLVDNYVSLNGQWGITIQYSSNDNLVYHNNIVENGIQMIDYENIVNYWYHPTLLEGNYWSDYAGVDDGSGTGKHAIAGDGIGDTLIPHYLDYYPFVNQSGWTPRDTTPPGDVNTTVIQRLDYRFNVSWTIPLDPDLKEFNIYRRLNDNPDTDTLIDTVPADYIQPYITGPGFDDGNLYQYMVTAVDTSGNEGRGAYAPEPPVPPIPFAPAGTLLTLGSALAAYKYYKRKRFRN